MKYLLIILFWAHAAIVSAQPEIISVVPLSGAEGQKLNVTVTVINTQLADDATIDFGKGINVLNTTISSSRLTAYIEIGQNASEGFRSIVITNGSEKITMEDAFEVFKGGNEARAVLTVIPKDVIYISDFDVNNLGSTPLLFTIAVYNDAVEKNLKLKLEVFHETYGKVVTAFKDLGIVSANEIVNVTNREFDEYNTTSASSELLNETNKTGMLPKGTYTYKLYLLNGSKVIAEDENESVISNQLTGLELIGPGVPLDETPVVINNPYPYFQWFSNSTDFSLTLYEVRDNQSSAKDIVTNLPVFTQSGIQNTFFIYPNSAEQLVEGQTYAWLVTATFLDSRGKQNINSEMYWFTYQEAAGTHVNVESIAISPENQTIKIGTTLKFTAIGYDKEGNQMDIVPEWSVVPSDGGTIDEQGLFKAGAQPKPVAIVADYGGIRKHTTVFLEWNPGWTEDIFFQHFIRDVFGLKAQ